MKLRKKHSTTIIVYFVLIALAVVMALLVAIRQYIFPNDSLLYNLYEAGYVTTPGAICIRIVLTLSVTLGFFSIGKLISYSGKKIKHSGAKTWTLLLGNVVSYVSLIVGFLLFLSVCGVNTAALITGAGVLTLVVGLGCQSLVADIVAGVSILLEGKFKVGDVVVISGWRGTVEEIGLRTTSLIDAVGNIKIINNSNIVDVVNNTKEKSVAICDVGIEYDESITHVEDVLFSNFDKIKEQIPAIIGDIQYKGVASLGDSAVVIRLIAYCKEENKYQVERDLNRAIKILFDQNGINIPFNQVTLSYRDNNKK